jgi:hypothetical protein
MIDLPFCAASGAVTLMVALHSYTVTVTVTEMKWRKRFTSRMPPEARMLGEPPSETAQCQHRPYIYILVGGDA